MKSIRHVVSTLSVLLLLTATVAEAQTVHLVLLLPAGRTPRADHLDAMDVAIRDLQAWFQRQLGDMRTFRVDPAGVRILYSTHSEDWFRSNPNSAPPFSRFFANAQADVESLLGHRLNWVNNTGDIWLISVDADPACGQCGGCGGLGVVVGDRNGLRGLVGQSYVPICPTDFDGGSATRACRSIGGMGHELGHALGLPHPQGCDAGAASCDHNALMWNGFRAYGDTYLRTEEKTTLRSSRFFEVREPFEQVAACHAGPAVVPSAPTGLSVNVSGPAVTLRWNATPSAVSYVLEAGSAAGGTDLFHADIGNVTTLTATAPAANYFVRVRARGMAGSGSPSNEINFRVGASPCNGAPPAPASLTFSTEGSNVRLTWSPAAASTSYVLEAGSAPGLADLFKGDVGSATSFAAAAPPGKYFVRVRAANACGLGSPSNELVLTVP